MASLTEVTKELQTQTKSLEDVSGGVNNLVKVIQAQIDAEKRGSGDSLEAEIKKRRASKSDGKGSTSFRGGLVDAIKQDTGFNFLGNLARWAFGGLTGALGALGAGGLVASFAPLLGKMVGRLITRGALGSALLLFGEDLFTKAFDYAGIEQYVSISEDDKKLYAASLSKALTTGLIVSIFGKKLGIATFFGSLLGDSIKSMFPADMNWEEKQSLFGLEMPFTKENFLEYGAIIAAFFGPGLIRGAIGKALGFGSVAAARGAPNSGTKTGFLRGFKPSGFKGLGWAGLLMFTGGLLADYAGEQTKNQGIADLLKISVTGLSLLALLGTGPLGIAAALAGFAIHGVLLMRDHYARKKAELDAEFEKQVAIQENEIADLTPDATILNAMRLAEQAGQNASSGNRDGLYSEQAAKEEAFIRKVERENPDEVAKLFLQEEIGFLKGELSRLLAMNSPAANDIRNQLKARLKEMETLTGQPSELLQQLNAPPPEPVGMDTGTPLSISAMPNRDDYSRWWKKKRAEDYDFKQDLKKYNMEIESLLPPAAAFLGSGGPPSVNLSADTQTINNGQVVIQADTPTADTLNGGAMRFGAVGSPF